MTQKSSLRLVAVVSLFLIYPYTAFADLILSAPPRETPETGESYYGPIAQSLSALLGEKVVYQHPQSWHNYTRKMRAGEYDIVFDGPHFAAWRIKHVNHVPVARLPGHLGFVIMAKKDDDRVKSVKDLIGKPFCGLASPNLGTMVVFSIFENPVIQPEIKIVKGGMKTVLKKFLEGECDYAVVRDTIYDNLPADKKQKIKIIVRSNPLPNQTITVNKTINEQKRKVIVEFMMSNNGSVTATNLLTRFSKKQKFFIPAREDEYLQLENLLEGVVFGW